MLKDQKHRGPEIHINPYSHIFSFKGSSATQQKETTLGHRPKFLTLNLFSYWSLGFINK